LNVGRDTQSYWSPSLEDRAFGAHHDAYKCKWTGFSTALPELDCAEDAVRWAYHSAVHAAVPTATVLLIPNKLRPRGRAAYNKWLDAFPCYCTRVAQIKGGPVPLQCDQVLYLDAAAPAPPPYSLDIVIVWNAAARAELDLDSTRTTALHAALHAACQQLSPGKLHATPPRRVDDAHHLGNCWGSQNTPTPAIEDLNGPYLKASRKFKLAHHEPTRQMKPNAVNHMHQSDTNIEQYKKDISQLRFKWDEIAYTDGSCLRQKDSSTQFGVVGAAVYIPNRDKHNHVLIDPAGMEATKTINRRELAGIWGSLTKCLCY